MQDSVDLARAATAAVDCMGVGATDDVLVLCNEAGRDIADALASAAEGRAERVRLVSYPLQTRHGEEPPAVVREAMSGATVILAATTFSLSHTRARLEASGRGARIATMPGLSAQIFARTLPVDYAQLRRTGTRIADALSAASSARVTSAAGTDIVLSLDGR